MKRLTLIRDTYTDKSTIGKLSIDGGQFCETLELPRYWNGLENVHGECCILEGLYKIKLIESPKRHYTVPLLLDVPGRDAIEIHILNVPTDTEGCIGVGRARGVDRINDSTSAFHDLMYLLGDDPEIEILIANSPEKLAEAGLT